MMATDPSEPRVADACDDPVVALLRAHGIIGHTEDVSAHRLAGGVSSDIVKVDRPAAPLLVVKRALRWLDVPTPWEADPARIVTEAAGLRLAGRIRPDMCPDVVLVVPDRHTMVLEGAPPDWRPWKARLFEGDVDLRVAGRLGTFIAQLHRRTAGDPDVRAEFDDLQHLLDLRVDAFYREAGRQHPTLAGLLDDYGRQLVEDRRCFVHGDFSPKNVLVGDDGAWVVDFEVAHYGSPLLDLAYMLHHLVMKALHTPPHAARLLGAAQALLAGYDDADGVVDPAERRDVIGHVGCLLLARVDGKSRSGYLRPSSEARVRARAPQVIRSPMSTLELLWEHMSHD